MLSEAFRLDYPQCLALLRKRLSEPPPGRVQVLSGPRQVGKTTLLLELAREHGDSAIYAAADGPEAALPGFWERLWSRAERLAAERYAVILLDEAHLLPDWAARLKGEWDRIRRRKIPIHVVVTGSSALNLATGSRESLAGRFERMTLMHWPASALAEVYGISPEEAAAIVVHQGSYPGAMQYRADWPRWSAYVRDSILEPAIGRDILSLAPVRKPALLRQVFSVCATSPAQIVSLQKIQGQLQDSGALETIADYLGLLEDAFLVASLTKHAVRTARRRAAPPKLVTLSNAFLAVMEPQNLLDPTRDNARFGAWVENACLAHAWISGQHVAYWREEPYEVDGIIDGTWGSWAIEVKTGTVRTADLHGLLEFCRRHIRYRPLLVCDEAAFPVGERLGVDVMTWTNFLVHGL